MRVVIHQSGQERKKSDPPVINWSAQPDPVDFPAARSFLGLIMPDDMADRAMELLKAAPITMVRAKDIVRGSAGEMLPQKLPGVQAEMDKMEAGDPASPFLLIQGSPDPGLNLVIADGWHRAHAAYYLDPTAWVPVKIAKGLWSEPA